VSVQVVGHPIGIDDRNQAIEEGDDVEDEDGPDHRHERAEQLDPVESQHDARDEGQEQERRRGETEGSHRGAGIEVAEAREQKRQERRSEGRQGARSCSLRFLHRA